MFSVDAFDSSHTTLDQTYMDRPYLFLIFIYAYSERRTYCP